MGAWPQGARDERRVGERERSDWAELGVSPKDWSEQVSTGQRGPRGNREKPLSPRAVNFQHGTATPTGIYMASLMGTITDSCMKIASFLQAGGVQGLQDECSRALLAHVSCPGRPARRGGRSYVSCVRIPWAAAVGLAETTHTGWAVTVYTPAPWPVDG